MWGLTPEAMAQYQAMFGGVDLDAEPPAPLDHSLKPCLRWCECGCSQEAIQAEPCWNCGDTSPRLKKPAWWPIYGSSMSVKNGDHFVVAELREEGGPGCPTQ